MIAGGTVTPALTAVDISLISQNPPDLIELRNIGSSASTGWGELNDAQQIEWFWQRSMSQGTAKGVRQTSDPANPAMIANFLAADGITTYDTANPPLFAALTATAITGLAGTFIVSMANTGTIAIGDYVRLYATTGELQIAGYSFQVTSVTTNVSITLGYMASSGITFAANATAAQVIKFIPNRMYPRWRYIANITQAAQAVVFFTERNDFTPGEIVSFRVSPDFGMDEINNRQARVLSVVNSGTVSSITLDLDTSGFTAFTFPTSAAAALGVSPAVCVPSSSGVVPDAGSATMPQQPPGTNLRDAFDNRNTRVIHCGGAMFTDGSIDDVWEWRAYKYDQYNQQ